MSRKSSHGPAVRKARAQHRAEMVKQLATRNGDVPRGRNVKVGDVAPYALSGHGKCRGTGMLSASLACPCATKRFLRAHPEVIIIPTGASTEVYWPATISANAEGSADT